MDAFAHYLPPERPLSIVDLGSGTGRFSPALAEAFGGPVHGVEPAAGMRAVADVEASHPRVRYAVGDAASIPLPDASIDLVLMSLSFHHVPDQAIGAREIARVVKPGGRAILRSTFRDRIPDIWWRSYFPRTWEIERAMFFSEIEARAWFESAGFSTLAISHIDIPPERDLTSAVERLKLRAYSVFEHMTAAELDEGFVRLDADLAAGVLRGKPTKADFIVFTRNSDR